MSKNKVAEWLKHTVDCEYYGNAINEELKIFLDNLYSDISSLFEKLPYISSKAKYTECINKLAEYTARFCDDVDFYLKDRLKDITDLESEWLINFMASNGTGYLKPKGILAKVEFSPYTNQRVYTDISKEISAKIYSSVDTSLRTAYLTKESTSSTLERIKAKENKINQMLDTEGTAFNTAAFRNVDKIIYQNNNQRLIYLATLDGRTCLGCCSYHGLTFDVSKAPSLPAHYNCRCNYIPVELISESEVYTFSEWIEELDENEKLDVLGKSRYELYKSGISVDKFVDNGNILTLDELKEL